MKTKTLKNIFKVLVILILIIVLGIIVHTVRNYIIVSDLEKKISTYELSTNFHLKAETKQNNNVEMILNYYKKDDKELNMVERITNGEILKVSYYRNKNSVYQYIDDEKNNKKIIKISDTGMFFVNIDNYLMTDNNFQKIFACFCANIKETELNGKKCYIINNFTSPSYLYSVCKNGFYIEKETGLVLKYENDYSTQIREYEFDNVDDSVFIQPDITEYEIEKE